jgi:hypothetical protein
MARRYRAFTEGQWIASSGNAVLCVTNPASSGKLIQLHQIEVHNNARGAASDNTNPSFCDIEVVRGTCEGGDVVSLAAHDTAISLPAGISVVTDAAWTATQTLRTLMFYKRMNPAGNALAQMVGPAGHIGRTNFNALVDHPHNANVERMRARPGEAVGLAIGNLGLTASMIWKCNFTIRVIGLGNWSGYVFIRGCAEAMAPLVVLNNSASDVVSIEQIDFQEAGTVDSPFLRLVNFNPDPVSLADIHQRVPVVKFDSVDDAFPGLVTCNTPGLPQAGIPQSYISDGSPATPKGVNYLHTKDFEGPQYRVMFPEANRIGRTLALNGGHSLSGNSQKKKMWAGESPIAIRPGESVAIVSSAETATATSAVPISAWLLLCFGLTMSVSDLVVPSITLTGLASGTVVAICEAGTETAIEILSESGGSVTWEYESSPGDFVDIAILAAGKVYQKIENLELTAVVRSIPVSQVDDSVYDGALSEALTFSGSTKRIIVNAGNTDIDVRAVYTEWVDWALLGSNLRFLPAFTTQGYTEIDPSAGTKIPAYAYLQNAWRVRPQEANHTLAVTGGVLLVDGGGDPFVDTLAAFTVRINYQQPVQAIVVNTAGTVAPTQGEIQTAVRAELATEMARIDTPVSTRASAADQTSIKNLIEADEVHTGTQVKKLLKGTSTELLVKDHAGVPLSTFTAVEP